MNRSTGENQLLFGVSRSRLMCFVALATLTHCSCRATVPLPSSHGSPPPLTSAVVPERTENDPRLPLHAATCPEELPPMPLPETICTEWSPPGIMKPWPADEYLHDGGDGQIPTFVVSDDDVRGIEPEDTIVHYDTVDGRTVFVPSNIVDIYSPRFAAVRRVESAVAHQQSDQLIEVEQPVKLAQHAEDRLASTTMQPVKAVNDRAIKQPTIQQLNERRGILGREQHLLGFESGFMPHEDFLAIRLGQFRPEEMALLQRFTTAAETWTRKQAVQIILDRVVAHEEVGEQRCQTTYTIDEPNHPRLRVIKVASTNYARPGETVDFTIRYDNIGDQVIGNVTLIDNLTTRLEYIPDTAKSSRTASFSTKPNEVDSAQLRWEFADPLEPGEGGIVRFHCKVR